MNITVMRFRNNMVKHHMDDVLKSIATMIDTLQRQAGTCCELATPSSDEEGEPGSPKATGAMGVFD